MKTLQRLLARFVTPVLAAAALAIPASAQTQFQGKCSNVKIQIVQELTLERIGFEATLTVTNNEGADALTDFSAALTFEDPALSTPTSTHDASSLFFVKPPELENINRVDGSGVIAPTKTATVKWFIIPTIGAGGTVPSGRKFRVGCNLGGKLQGIEIPKSSLFAIADTITVKPEPQLRITYFQPRDVTGDDPFTPEVESPIPFTLGVLVHNHGHGPAKKLKIDSKQPKIVENQNGLLLVARLLGARVNDSPLNEANLLVDLGDILPTQTAKGSWDMITSLSGHFIEFKASYTHAPDLGGEATSIITDLDAHFIAHECINDDPGRDLIKDFLADVDRDANEMPDALYETDEGNILPVNHQSTALVSGAPASNNVQVSIISSFENWIYMRVPDPGQNRLPITRIQRSDGKVLNKHNFWTNTNYTRVGNVRQDWLNIFDKVANATSYTYNLTYDLTASDTLPPVTRIRFSGDHSESGGVNYITRDTQIYFTSEDQSPVSIEYKIGSGTYAPALPFTITTPGTYTITFRAKDQFNNQEAEKTAQVVISGAGPSVTGSNVAVGNMFLPGSANVISVRSGETNVSFTTAANPIETDGVVQIYRGVVAWPRLAGVPPSPTPSGSATLNVSGSLVDYYKYKVGSGTWSPEFPVATPISLSGLTGAVTVAVLGRSQYGNYLPDDQALTASWTVTPGSPALTVVGLPPSPMPNTSFNLTFSGSNLTHYRSNLDNTFFQAEAAVATPYALNALSLGDHNLKVIGKRSNVWQDTASPTQLNWKVDNAYGYKFDSLPLVKTQSYDNIAGQTLTNIWNGTNDAGVPQLPGPYTVKLTLTDALGRQSYEAKVVFIENLSSGETALAGSASALPHARGRRAVWQERVGGVWNIRARNLDTGTSSIAVTNATLAQEKPRTDGRYVVWQARTAIGGTDIYYADLSAPTVTPLPVTVSNRRNEINPVIDFPWVVYQYKPSATPASPWQLEAKNLLTNTTQIVHASTQDQLTPSIHAGRVVWQDWRDVGPGEIYFADLESGERRRLTNQPAGQYNPAIWGHLIVWQDNRNTQVDLWKYDLLKGVEERLTNTAYNEVNPDLQGPWLMYLEDSLGSETENLRLLDLESNEAVPVTRAEQRYSPGSLGDGYAVWAEGPTDDQRIIASFLPSLQTLARNQNTVVVTADLASRFTNAFALLTAWNQAAGVTSVTRFQSLAQPPVTQTASFVSGSATGTNFTLTAGDFLWIKFNQARLVDLGDASNAPVALASGKNVLSYTNFPVGYTAFDFVTSIGQPNVRAIRMLDSVSGAWRTLEVKSGQLVGANFMIPRVTALLVDMVNPVASWKP